MVIFQPQNLEISLIKHDTGLCNTFNEFKEIS